MKTEGEKMPESPTRHLTVFLLKEDVKAPEDALRADRIASRHQVLSAALEIGTLWVGPTRRRPPRWSSLFEGQADPPLKLLQSSAAAVLIVPAAERLFALTFGYGRYLLVPGSWEERFGLLVTLNSIDPDRVRSLDKQTFDAISRQTRTQASRPGPVADFGLDVEQDLLQAVTGEPLQPNLGRRISGRDALAVSIPLSLDSLPSLLGLYEERFRATDYQENFKWVDHIAEVGDPAQRRALNDALLDKIRNQDLDRTWLSVPEPIDWSWIEGFRYTPKGEIFPDLHWRDFLAQIHNVEELSLPSLKRRYISAVDVESQENRHRWPVYHCIYCELETNGDTYLLAGGKWYRVTADFVEEVNLFVDALYAPAAELPEASNEPEEAYNRRVAEGDPDRFALMDRKMIQYGGGFGRIEFCDLFDKKGDIIHVKRYGGSSVLSHLFAQGVVAATLFVQEPKFRELVNDRLPPSHKFEDPMTPPDPRKHKIIFAIISRKHSELTLPFFSRVNLRNAARQLRGIGFDVVLVKIDRE